MMTYPLEQLCTIITKPDAKPITGSQLVIGVDEVGRGALFANMTVCAVILPIELTGLFSEIDLSDTPLKLLNDSKKLTEKRRESLFEPIKALALDYAIVDVPRAVIDTINISKATMLGIRLAMTGLIAKHGLSNDTALLVDGNEFPTLSDSCAARFYHQQTMIKGDATHTTIACASILAKVHRDRQMIAYGAKYPEYHIDSHKGYLTAVHKAAIMTHGILPEHRRSYMPITQLYRDGFVNNAYWVDGDATTSSYISVEKLL